MLFRVWLKNSFIPKTRMPALCLLVLFISVSCLNKKPGESPEKPAWVLVIHGGAGVIEKKDFNPGEEDEYKKVLEDALNSGSQILKHGGTALDAVEVAVRILEDSPLFNAGKGAVFNADGVNELDAAIMDGSGLKAGAVAGLTTVKNPISAARAVMTHSEHVMLIGEGAEEFSRKQGLEMVTQDYFYTERRWQQYLKAKKKSEEENHRMGTVGAVALDMKRHLAAATSTGGMTFKKYGRVGDVPVIGAGTYANDSTCAVSATGHGEYFIRNVVAHSVSAMMELKNHSLEEAATYMIHTKLKNQGGKGGLIAVDKNGNVCMPFNTSGMFRGYVLPGKEPVTLIFGDEEN